MVSVERIDDYLSNVPEEEDSIATEVNRHGYGGQVIVIFTEFFRRRSNSMEGLSSAKCHYATTATCRWHWITSTFP